MEKSTHIEEKMESSRCLSPCLHHSVPVKHIIAHGCILATGPVSLGFLGLDIIQAAPVGLPNIF